MLCVNRYPQDYIDQCKSRVKQQLGAYRELIAAATNQGKPRDPKVSAAVESFEAVFFNNMVLVLESYFCHRSRTIEGKDGNPLNEVRVLCSSMLEHKGLLRVEKAIKLKPETSVLRLKVGAPIALSEGDFSRLSKAFFDEMERKFA